MSAVPHVGDVGTAIRVRVRDENGAVVDVSAAAAAGTKLIYLTSAGIGGASYVLPASFVTDGTDGWIQYVTVADGVAPDTVPGTLNKSGGWTVHGWVRLSAAIEFTTLKFSFDVDFSPRFPGY